MPLDIQLERPDAGYTITLRADTFGWGGKNATAVGPLPTKDTLFFDEGFRARTFSITGQLDPANWQTDRRDLDDAWQNWNRESLFADGEARLIWGLEPGDVNDYDFNVVIVDMNVDWVGAQPGSATRKILKFTMTLAEVGAIGTLNATGPAG